LCGLRAEWCEVHSLSCSVALVLGQILQIFWWLMSIYAIVSFFPSLQGRWTYYLARVIEPVLNPVRRIIPPVGGLDLAFLAVIILVGYLKYAIPNIACTISY
jgi:YggT family protein